MTIERILALAEGLGWDWARIHIRRDRKEGYVVEVYDDDCDPLEAGAGAELQVALQDAAARLAKRLSVHLGKQEAAMAKAREALRGEGEEPR